MKKNLRTSQCEKEMLHGQEKNGLNDGGTGSVPNQ